MELIGIENFRLIERNKALADTFFIYNNEKVRADFVFYLQRDACLGIKVGRHDTAVPTKELENYIRLNKASLKSKVQPEVARVKAERLARLMNEGQ